MLVYYSAVSDRGNYRNENQDVFAINHQMFASECRRIHCSGSIEINQTLFFSVFDGMGGESCGAKAAQLAADSFCETCQTSPEIDLPQICMKMNEAVYTYMHSHNIRSMGTTAAFLQFTEREVQLCNIGDSRIYRINEMDFEQLSQDHSEQFGALSSRRVLTQHLGIPPLELVIEPHFQKIPLSKDDRFLLCTDGLTDMIDDEKIHGIILQNEVEKAAEKLIEAALENGGKDNVTAIVCKVD